MHPEQTTFFASLDFPGRTTLTVGEISERLGYSEQHIINLIESNEMPALDGKGRDSSRSARRVPIEMYRNFVSSRMTGPQRNELLRALPEATRTELMFDLFRSLPAAARSGAIAELRRSLGT